MLYERTDIAQPHLVKSLGTYTHGSRHIFPPAYGVIVKISFQYLQRLVMQPAISFWQSNFQRCIYMNIYSLAAQRELSACVSVWLHAFGLSTDQTPTALSQPLRTAGDLWRTKNSMKGEGKEGGRREGAVLGSLSSCVFALLCETTLFLTRRSLPPDYRPGRRGVQTWIPQLDK